MTGYEILQALFLLAIFCWIFNNIIASSKLIFELFYWIRNKKRSHDLMVYSRKTWGKFFREYYSNDKEVEMDVAETPAE